jgi:hypothetical protein
MVFVVISTSFSVTPARAPLLMGLHPGYGGLVKLAPARTSDRIAASGGACQYYISNQADK